MILIKDRHSSKNSINSLVLYGKYDTYKGSTLKNIFSMITTKLSNGKYDTYKGSTLGCDNLIKSCPLLGKYDTYKGSTPAVNSAKLYSFPGKYDTCKGLIY